MSYLVLHRNYIYIDSDYKVEFICIPLEDMQEEVDVNSFLRNLIASLRFEPSENGDYVAKMLTYVNNPAIFNLHNMLTLVEELMENYGIEIPEDDASDIYVDYQEVEEKSAADLVEELDDSEDDFMEDLSANELSDESDIPTIDSKQEEIPAETIEETIEEEPEEEQPEETIEDEIIEEELEEIVEEEIAEEELEETVEDKIVEEEPEETAEEEAAEEEPEEIVEEETAEEEPEETVEEEAAEEEPEETIEDNVVWEQPENPYEEEEDSEQAAEDDKTTEEAQEIVEQLKNKAKADVQSKSLDESEEESDEDNTDKKKGFLKPVFKTKETTITGTVIPDELDEFLAEKEREEQEQAAHHEESSLKIKKNIKVSRASIVKNSQEEQKATEEALPETSSEAEDKEQQDIETADADAKQTAATANTAVPKVNPYLIRVNTDERIMITKQTFKLGKASMGVDYTVKGNSAVSRVHAIITNKDGVYSVKDNKSTNHTFVNGKILEEGESADLSNDSKIVLGDEEFIFKLS